MLLESERIFEIKELMIKPLNNDNHRKRKTLFHKIR